jgi:hypothetical protein
VLFDVFYCGLLYGGVADGVAGVEWLEEEES